MNPNDSAPFDPNSEGSFSPDLSPQGGDEFGDQETVPSMDENSWLLEEEASSNGPDFEHASVHALPDAFAEPPSQVNGTPDVAGPEEGVYEDDLVGASYVEPETSGHAFSKALIPGSIVLLLSFGGVGAWAFLKHSKEAAATDPVVAVEEAHIETPEPEPEVELVKPEDAGDEPIGRMSYQRDGAVVPASRFGQSRSVKATVGSPREPGELPPEVAGAKATGAADASRAEAMGVTGAMEVAAADGMAFAGEGTAPTAPDESSPESDDDGLDIEFGIYVDSDESSLLAGGDESRASFHVADLDPSEMTDDEPSTDLDGGSSIKSLSPAFLESFILDVEPLDEEAIAMLEALEGGEVLESEVETKGSDAPALPLPLEGGYGSMAWTFPSSIRPPMSPIPGDEESGGEDRTSPFETVADTNVHESAGEMGPALSEDFLPFSFFDDDRASLDVEPDIRSLDVTELELPSSEPEATTPDDNLSLGSSSPESFSSVPDTVAVEETSEKAPESAETVAPEPMEFAAADEAPEPAEIQEPDVAIASVEPVTVPAEITDAAEINAPKETSQATDFAQEPEAPEVPALTDVPAQLPAVELAEASPAPVDMDDAHARLDAIFGPTPVEVEPAPMVATASEPAPAEATVPTEVVAEPQMSEEFSAPETLAEAEVATEAPEEGVDAEEVEQASPVVVMEPVVDVAAERPVQETPVEEALVGPVAPEIDGADPLTVAMGEGTGIATEGPLPTEIPSEETEAIVLPDSTPETVLPTVAEVLAVPEMTAPEGPVELPLEVPIEIPAEVAIVAPREVAVEMSEVDAAEVGAPEEVAVEVRPSLADEVASPRRGSILTRISNDEIWPHRTVPKSKLKGEMFVLTPNVGQVRIVFDGGDTLDGRLHGVGDHKIALDTRLGRLTLDARRVDRLDRLGKDNQRTTTGQVSTKGLERVRVQADGGVFLGHLLSREGNRVTLLLSEGMRVTLESDDIRPAGRQKTVSRLRRPK